MNNNEEPQLTPIADLQVASAGHKLPEQAQVPECSIPRPFSFQHLINQWQPMGIRVTLNIPFIGNDKDYIFAIRNGPFIPRFDKTYRDFKPWISTETSPTLVDVQSYAWNNTRNVMHAKSEWKNDTSTKDSIYITYYDYPPPLAQFATMFRKWRGTMCYRIRTVAGFTTQGYPFVSMIRNMPSSIGIYDENIILPAVQRQDDSYREVMLNSYVMGDTAMVRHFEFSVPYEYPTPWYDQFAWIAKRTRPATNFYRADSTVPEGTYTKLAPLVNEPHGDNYIVVGLRGALNTSVNAAQISFELEYRAGEDFQFSDPGLPLGDFLLPYSSRNKTQQEVKQTPSPNWTSDGIGIPKKKDLPRVQNRMATLHQTPPRTRNPRNIVNIKTEPEDELADTVDASSTYSDGPIDLDDVSSLNLRKALRF